MAKLCYVEGEYRDALGDPHVSLIRITYGLIFTTSEKVLLIAYIKM